MYQFFKEYFRFNSRERVAVVLLICLMGVFWVLPSYYQKEQLKPISLENSHVNNAQTLKIDSFSAVKTNQQAVELVNTNIKASLFYFDPNKIDASGWEKLGLRKKLIQTILNYRSKGGKFRQPADLLKIWGMQQIEANRLIPYVNIEKDVPIEQKHSPTVITNQKPVAEPKIIDVNTATIADWQILPGMTMPLAARIVHFRDKIGGFKRLDQVKKTYGLSDSVFQLISPFLQIVKVADPLININTASIAILQQCKFISAEIAKAIVVYRNAYGPFKEVDDLKKIIFITNEQLEKMKPFIVTQ